MEKAAFSVAVKVGETELKQQMSNDLIFLIHFGYAVCHCMHVCGTACLRMLCNIVMTTMHFTLS
jgi:putative Mn2+ efflux pump MntP